MEKEFKVVEIDGMGLVISDDGIMIDNWGVKSGILVFFNKMKIQYIESQFSDVEKEMDSWQKVIATIHTRHADFPLIVLPEEDSEAEVLLKQLKHLMMKEHGYHANSNHIAHIDRVLNGYKQANKGFSEANVISAMRAGNQYATNKELWNNPYDDFERDFINSLTAPKAIESVVLEYKMNDFCDCGCDTYTFSVNYVRVCSRCNKDLEMKLKTTATPEGETIAPIRVTFKK